MPLTCVPRRCRDEYRPLNGLRGTATMVSGKSAREPNSDGQTRHERGGRRERDERERRERRECASDETRKREERVCQRRLRSAREIRISVMTGKAEFDALTALDAGLYGSSCVRCIVVRAVCRTTHGTAQKSGADTRRYYTHDTAQPYSTHHTPHHTPLLRVHDSPILKRQTVAHTRSHSSGRDVKAAHF